MVRVFAWGMSSGRLQQAMQYPQAPISRAQERSGASEEAIIVVATMHNFPGFCTCPPNWVGIAIGFADTYYRPSSLCQHISNAKERMHNFPGDVSKFSGAAKVQSRSMCHSIAPAPPPSKPGVEHLWTLLRHNLTTSGQSAMYVFRMQRQRDHPGATA